MPGGSVPLVGGPLCGRGCGWKREFAYFGDLGGPSPAPTDVKPHLYRLMRRRRSLVYVYAGHTHVRCPGCDGFHLLRREGERVDNCSLCGADLRGERAAG